MFLLKNKKDISIFQMKKAPYLLLWHAQDDPNLASLSMFEGTFSLDMAHMKLTKFVLKNEHGMHGFAMFMDLFKLIFFILYSA